MFEPLCPHCNQTSCYCCYYCGEHIVEHAPGCCVDPSPDLDWLPLPSPGSFVQYRACPTCFAKLSDPCVLLSGREILTHVHKDRELIAKEDPLPPIPPKQAGESTLAYAIRVGLYPEPYRKMG